MLYHAQENAQRKRLDRRIVLQVITQPLGNRRHPLADRQSRKNVVGQMGGGFDHSAGVASGTDATALAPTVFWGSHGERGRDPDLLTALILMGEWCRLVPTLQEKNGNLGANAEWKPRVKGTKNESRLQCEKICLPC